MKRKASTNETQLQSLAVARDHFAIATAALISPMSGANLGLAIMCATEGLAALVAADRSGSGQRWAHDRIRRRMAKANP